MIFKLFVVVLTVHVHTINSAVLPSGKDVDRLGQLIATSLVRNSHKIVTIFKSKK